MSDDDFVDPHDFDEHGREEESHDFDDQAKLDELFLRVYTGQFNDASNFEIVKIEQRPNDVLNERARDDLVSEPIDAEALAKETAKNDKIGFKDGTFFVESNSASDEADAGKKRKRNSEEGSEEGDRNSKRPRKSDPLPAKPALRYWDDAKTQFTVRCYRCGKMGHMSTNCSDDAKVEKCPLCGGNDHGMNKCPFELCHRCKQPGHLRKDCNNRPHLIPVCYICRRSGHDPAMCQELLPLEEKKSFCANCARTGHSARFCNEPRTDDFRLLGQRGGNWDQIAEKLKQGRRASTGTIHEKSFSDLFQEGNRKDRDQRIFARTRR